MVVLDTSIIIDHLRQNPGTFTHLYNINKKIGMRNLFISPITIQELYEGKSTLSGNKLKEMLLVLAPLEILEYNREIAEIAGIIARDSKIPMEFADASIAATCIFNNADLATLNVKHFENIANLNIYPLV
jgi:predicted nucleic acid-binding protein